jgi:hypothetical protein
MLSGFAVAVARRSVNPCQSLAYMNIGENNANFRRRRADFEARSDKNSS